MRCITAIAAGYAVLFAVAGCKDVAVTILPRNAGPDTVYDPPPPDFRFKVTVEISEEDSSPQISPLYTGFYQRFRAMGYPHIKADEEAKRMAALK